MSFFQFPRLYLKGTFVFNPGTANNDVITPKIVNLVPPYEGTYTSDSNTVAPVHADWSDTMLQEYMLSTYDSDRGPLLYGQWNVFGDMTYWFNQVQIVGAELQPNQLLNTPQLDSIVGTDLSITKAVMIDLNPEGFNTTQFLADNFVLSGTPEALGKRGTYVSRKPNKGFTQWINPYRNLTFHGTAGSSGEAGGLSASFFTAWEVRPEDLDTSTMDLKDTILTTGNSPTMQEIVRILQNDPRARGLQLRMNYYLTYPLISDKDLKAKFDAGDFADNPAYGKLVGCIGVWYDDEPSGIAMGRYLNWKNKYNWQVGGSKGSAFLGTAVGQLNDSFVSLDVSNTFPESDINGDKYNMGKVLVGATISGVDNVPLGEIDYLTANYEARGGMVDVVFSQEVQESLQKYMDEKGGYPDVALYIAQITRDKPNDDVIIENHLLAELDYMFGSNDQCTYVEQRFLEDGSVDYEMKFYVYHRGAPVPEGFSYDVKFKLWLATPTGVPTAIDYKPDPGQGYPYKDPGYIIPADASDQILTLTGPNPSISISGMRPVITQGGIYTFRLANIDQPTQPGMNIINESLFNFRVLPNDQYNFPAEEITWDFIYQNIFRYYYLILPAMNRHLDMKEEANWNNIAAAFYLSLRTDPDLVNYYSYMPRTRDLSWGKRDLLLRWAQQVLKDNGYTEFETIQSLTYENYRTLIDQIKQLAHRSELSMMPGYLTQTKK